MPSVLTLEKSLKILEAVVASPGGAGTRALAKAFGLNVATVHNIAMTLVRHGYLRQDEDTRHFHAGIRLSLLGRSSSAREPLALIARHAVQRLSDKLNESVMVVAMDNGHLTNLAFAPSRQALRVQEPEDMSAFAHCTAVGKVLLANLGQPRRAAFFTERGLDRHTPKTITTNAALERELANVRNQGYAQTRDELCEGISAYAVPIRDPWGSVFAAIGASAPSFRMKRADTIKTTLTGLREAAATIESSLTQTSSPPSPA